MGLDLRDDAGSLSEQERITRKEKLSEFQNLINMEEISWRQKSRILWLKEGDRNTRYFHRIASANKRRNWITNLQVNGRMLNDQGEINQSIVDYYMKLFKEDAEWRPKMDEVVFSNLSSLSAADLEKPFSEAEVYQAVLDLNGEKAPGPDGWNIKFFQSC